MPQALSRLCHNARTHTEGTGFATGIQDLVQQAEERCCNRRITISGGEPLEQLPALYAFIRALKARSFEVCIYTGWELPQVPQELISLIDYLKVGPFIAALKDAAMQYVGSSNQRMFCCRSGQMEGIPLKGMPLIRFCA